VTMFTGLVATVAGMFPGIAMRLLDFVMLYGLLLMPMGAIVFVDFWIFPKLGLKQYYAEHRRIKFNLAAGVSWFATMGICYALYKSGNPIFQLYFVALPGWFIASALYISISKFTQKGDV